MLLENWAKSALDPKEKLERNNVRPIFNNCYYPPCTL